MAISKNLHNDIPARRHEASYHRGNTKKDFSREDHGVPLDEPSDDFFEPIKKGTPSRGQRRRASSAENLNGLSRSTHSRRSTSESGDETERTTSDDEILKTSSRRLRRKEEMEIAREKAHQLSNSSSDLAAVIAINQKDHERRRGRSKSPGRLAGHLRCKSPGGCRSKSPGRLRGRSPGRLARSGSFSDRNKKRSGSVDKYQNAEDNRSSRGQSPGKYRRGTSPGKYSSRRGASPGKYQTNDDRNRRTRSSSTERVTLLLEEETQPTPRPRPTRKSSKKNVTDMDSSSHSARGRRHVSKKSMLDSSEHSSRGRRHRSSRTTSLKACSEHPPRHDDSKRATPRRTKSLELSPHDSRFDEDFDEWDNDFEWDFDGDADVWEEHGSPTKMPPARSASDDKLHRPAKQSSLKKTTRTLSIEDVAKLLQEPPKDFGKELTSVDANPFPRSADSSNSINKSKGIGARKKSWEKMIQEKKLSSTCTDTKNTSWKCQPTTSKTVGGKVSYFEQLTKHNPSDFSYF